MPRHPADVLAAALVGHVRGVVVDSRGTVIDLGARQRLFTGSARAAALLQALLRSPGGLGCLWPGCDAHGGCLQVDHRDPARNHGPRSEEHTSELQSLMRISYAVFCLKKKNTLQHKTH